MLVTKRPDYLVPDYLVPDYLSIRCKIFFRLVNNELQFSYVRYRTEERQLSQVTYPVYVAIPTLGVDGVAAIRIYSGDSIRKVF